MPNPCQLRLPIHLVLDLFIQHATTTQSTCTLQPSLPGIFSPPAKPAPYRAYLLLSAYKYSLSCLLLPWLAACSSFLAGPGGGLIGVPTHLYDFNPEIYTVISAEFEFLGVAGVSGGEECCATLPRIWRPGLMATVRWVEDPNPCLDCGPKDRNAFREYMKKKQTTYQHYSAQVEIPPYKDTYGINLAFLPCHQVRLVIDSKQVFPMLAQWEAEAKQLEGQSCPKPQ
ncbi:DUF3304 domain-containing protein [Aquitalea sp. ASV15]|uniref:DUF3304 domain-containing protein n=1 Tax=Aquitalea sp. ASV15 TaxID=2795104 RepID=UPI0018EC94A3|nr:DUF3304 domain-containing protein [Aquitalea sp. ASV15]